MVDAETRIFGYASRVRDHIHCPACFEDSDATARILRVDDASEFPEGLQCDACGLFIFFPSENGLTEKYLKHMRWWEEALERLSF